MRRDGALLLDEFRGELQFGAIWLALQCKFVETLDFLFRAAGVFHFGPFQKMARLFDNERTVHHEERLLRDGSIETLRAGAVRRGEIERPEHAGQILAINETVDGAARLERLFENVLRVPANLQIDRARNREECVAHRFKFEATTIHF